jgi:hypothetical protein
MKKLQPLLLELMNHVHSLEDTKDSGSAPVNVSKKQGEFCTQNVKSERTNRDEITFKKQFNKRLIKCSSKQ